MDCFELGDRSFAGRNGMFAYTVNEDLPPVAVVRMHTQRRCPGSFVNRAPKLHGTSPDFFCLVQ